MKIYAAMVWVEWQTCSAACPSWGINRCPHPKTTHGEYRPRVYTKVGQAKSFVTQANKARRPKHGIEPHNHDPYVVEGDTDDMVRIDFDAQQRYEHFENRMSERANEAQRNASGPIPKPKRKRKVT